MKKLKLKKKNATILGAGILGIILIIVIIMIFGSNQEKELRKHLKQMGKEFYSEFYYDLLTKDKNEKEIADLLSQWSKSPNGIKINLDNLSKCEKCDTAKKEEVINQFKYKDKECDKINTKVIVYPQKPYGKDDFTIETIVKCGFSKEDKRNP